MDSEREGLLIPDLDAQYTTWSRVMIHAMFSPQWVGFFVLLFKFLTFKKPSILSYQQLSEVRAVAQPCKSPLVT